MSERFTPTNALEESLATHSRTLEDLGVFLQRLMVSKVIVLVRQDTGGVVHPLKIPAAQGTPMVALFTSELRATMWAERYEEYRTAVVVDARRALLQIESGCGAAVNPGHAVGFEVSAEGLPRLLRDFAPLQSGVLTSPADGMLTRAIARTLDAPSHERAPLFERLTREIAEYMAAHPAERPWTCTVYTGTDGSRVFRGGIGHSLVIDTAGRLWRARSYEDFETTYDSSDPLFPISSLTPIYGQMRRIE